MFAASNRQTRFGCRLFKFCESRGGISGMKVAVIGCGSMGTKHINNLLELGHEVAICDSNIFRLKESAQKFQIQKTCENFRDLPDLFNPDAAIIATDTSFHAKI